MTPVICQGLALSVVPDSDVRAIATYFSDIDHARAHEPEVEPAVKRAMETSPLDSGQEDDPDANLYAPACLSCHSNSGTAPLPARPELALNSALTLPEPTNFIQPVLRGIGNTEGAPGLVMPAYASSLTDSEVARLAAYLRRTRTTRPPWTDLENKVSAIRRKLAASH
jgi:cytochrome c553